MQRTFNDTIMEMRGLINEWSAPLRHDVTEEARDDSESGAVVLLAVSGGIDSMCMAELFASLEEPLPFAVAHCNFNLRGEESDEDEMLVKEWAAAHGVEMHSVSFDTDSYAREHGISIEMAARDLRYSWFESLCFQHGYKAVAVAHNANDNAETLVLNLLRGSGLHGLSGMSKISVLPCSSQVHLIRPLLDCTRKQIEGYMFARKAAYREDSTNASSDYKRNRIRNEVFPIFGTVNPSFVLTMNREMGYFAEAGEIVDDWCRSVAPSVARADGDLLRISLPVLMEHRHWRYLLYHILEPYGFGSAVLASLEDLLTSSRTISGKRFEAGMHVLLTGRDELTVVPVSEQDRSEDHMTVDGPGTYVFNGRIFRVEVVSRSEIHSLKQPEGVLIMDADKLRFPFVLRRWQTGDRMVPFGMKGRKKLSDMFADLKYDALKKADAVVVADASGNGHVAGLACVRADDRYKITGSASTVIRITESR